MPMLQLVCIGPIAVAMGCAAAASIFLTNQLALFGIRYVDQ